MPKRDRTPPPPEDEPRYLVVVHPYPLNANLQLHGDRRALALWLACCIGKDALYAMFYKPASPGMVIIEVDRYFERFESLLGMHTWSSFLRKPMEEEKDKSSKVFWCQYNSGRLVQKNGWKCVDVKEHWFQGWSPSNNTIKHPYPKTTYCDVPAEAQTGMPLCRPLPKDTFTPPPPRVQPAVGSVEWVNSRSSEVFDAPSPPTKRRRRNYGRDTAPSDSISRILPPTAISGIGAQALPKRPRLSQWLAEQCDSQPVWPRPPSTISASFTLTSSTSSSSVGSRTHSALGATSAAAPPPARPTRPPSLLSVQSAAQLRDYEHSDWRSDIGCGFEVEQDGVQMSLTTSVSTKSGPGRSKVPPHHAPEPPGAIDPDREYEYEEEDMPKHSTADAMRDIFYTEH